ncbi:MAG: phosphoglucosamine mutase [Mycobacterium sp.]|nr:phosphoglucosamine mutase [Mycobacterium sp.]
MGRLFGTDGVRGLANVELTPELAMAVGAAAVRALDVRRPRVVIGRDTRPSGELLEAAVVAGLASAGADVVQLGVVPTPAVAHAVAASGAQLGIVLSASHNPMPDNGIKIFGSGGFKLADEVEDRIEALTTQAAERRPTGADIGRLRVDASGPAGLVEGYVRHLLAAVKHPLDGLKIVVDCAQGAASVLSPRVLREAGAEVIALAADGDGYRINDACGATSTASLQAAVVAHGADAGIAHDGDADRCLAVDAAGLLVDGDQILAIAALALRERGALAADTVVATVMSNLGFRHAMQQAGIGVLETAVGDRYVLEAMRAGSYSLGGEQSGHVVFAEHATTGDGLLTALVLLERIAATGASLAELAGVMTRLPQVLLNVRADRAVANAPAVLAAVDVVAAELGTAGRVLLRPSGTEPLVRVMVEAATPELARSSAERIAAVVSAS